MILRNLKAFTTGRYDKITINDICALIDIKTALYLERDGITYLANPKGTKLAREQLGLDMPVEDLIVAIELILKDYNDWQYAETHYLRSKHCEHCN